MHLRFPICLSFVAALWLSCVPASAQGKKVVLFAELTEDSPVEMADGSRWMMDKGDAFPLVMFKEQQTVLVLQLVGTTFTIPAKSARVIEEKDVTAEVLASYRRNVVNFLDGKVKKWRSTATGASP